MKSKRQERILELIERHEIETQDDMMNALRDDYYWQEMPLADRKRNNGNWR